MKKSIHETIASFSKNMRSIEDALNKRKAALLASVAAVDAEILEYHNALQEIHPHDCSQSGTRKVYQFANIRDAIVAHLPTSAGKAITAEVLWQKMKESRLTYALNSVNMTLSSHWTELQTKGVRKFELTYSGMGRPANSFYKSLA